MANFEVAVNKVLEFEGGLTDNPQDRGGLTNFGISQRSFPNIDIRALTVDKAKDIYRNTHNYWNGSDLWEFNGVIDQAVASKLLDMRVNMGVRKADELIQSAVNHAGETVRIDGSFGPRTLLAVNSLDPERLLHELRYISSIRYVKIVITDPSQAKFLNGWLWRAAA